MNEAPMPAAAQHPPRGATASFLPAMLFWLKLGLICFGGPAGQVARGWNWTSRFGMAIGILGRDVARADAYTNSQFSFCPRLP